MNAILQSVQLPNGETIAYRKRAGGEETICLVHGNMISSYHWDIMFDHFDDRYTLIAPDLRGQGKSSYVNPINSLNDFANDLKAFVDTLKLPIFHLMGWSMGGGIAMQFASTYASHVNKLILVSSMSTRGYPFFKVNAFGKTDYRKRLKSKEEIKNDRARYIPISNAYESKNTAFLEQILNVTMYPVNKPKRSRYRAYLKDILQQRNLLEVYNAMNRFNISHQSNGVVEGTKEVDKIHAPTLLLWGDKDVIVSREMQEEIIQDFNGRANMRILKNVGHSPLIDDFTSFEREVLQFLTA